MNEKVDFKKTLGCYTARREFALVDVPELAYLMIDGHGDPNAGGPFSDAVTALYSIGYPLKFASKRQLGRDYAVMPLEGLWSASTMANFTTALDKSTWDWTLLMMVPDWITPEMVAEATASARAKAGEAADRVRLERLAEGRSVQILHVGPFDAEAETLHRLHAEYLPEHGLAPSGRHHEIYLSDFTRTAPERLRTILRQPVTQLGAPQ